MLPHSLFRLVYEPEKDVADGWFFDKLVRAILLSSGLYVAAWMENPNFWVVEYSFCTNYGILMCTCMGCNCPDRSTTRSEGEELDEFSDFETVLVRSLVPHLRDTQSLSSF